MPSQTTTTEMPARYVPADHEDRIRARWDEARAFHAAPQTVLSGAKPPYCMVIPPPNVTAALHLGHALNNTLQDVLARFHRMRGFETLWMPGADHAGIATQTVVEKRLLETEGKRRTEYERDAFIAKVQEWKDEYEERIRDQLKRMGCSCDWERWRFTMDEQCARAVRAAFFQLFKAGLIYRGKRLVNWDPVTQTALADDEVENIEIDGNFYYLRYPLVDNAGKGISVTLPDGSETDHVTVATTRPETFLGDTAVAMNPKDPRATAFAGKKVRLPFVNRIIPIIQDDYVVLPAPDPDAPGVDPKAKHATGFLKVTPAHDPNDWEIGRRHDLEAINVMAPDASISYQHGWSDVGDARRFVGMSREEARKEVVKAFKAEGLHEETRPYRHGVGHSYRSHAPIEPYLSDQWYVKVTDDRLVGSAQRALAKEQRSEASLGGTALRAVTSTPPTDPGGTARRAVSTSTHSLQPIALAELDTTGAALPPIRPAGFVGRDPYPPNEKSPSDLELRSRKLPHLTMPGATYFVTWRVADGRGLDESARNEVLAAFAHRHLALMQVFAAVVMPDHVHAIVRPFDNQDLLTIVGALKRFTASAINKKAKTSGSLWQDEHFDHILRDEAEFSEALLYIARNPVEACLVDRPTAYGWLAVQECVAVELRHAVQLRSDGSASRPTKSPSSDGEMEFHPERYAKTYESWHDGLRDWCISRQLWWGHRIPVWSAALEGTAKPDQQLDSRPWLQLISKRGIDKDDPRVWTQVEPRPEGLVVHFCLAPDAEDLEEKFSDLPQDPDVLDTWFSSALWPLSTMGWPDETNLLGAFNPTSVLCTAREIITLWVSRMVMFNRYFKDGDLPYKDVYIHAMIQDGEGRKMSKSLGNGVDPLDIIHSHGADALRYTCCKLATNTQDVRMPVETDPETGRNTSPKFDEGMKFANKLWNASRFTIMMLTEAEDGGGEGELTLVDRWMLSRLAASLKTAERAIEEYEFSQYAQTIYDLLWRDYCDWYLEAVKPTVKTNPAQRAVLRNALDAILRMLHPVCPFVTEAIYERLREVGAPDTPGLTVEPAELLCSAAWPEASDDLRDEKSEESFERLRELIVTIRDLRARQKTPPKARPTLHIDDALAQEITAGGGVVETLAGLNEVTTAPADESCAPFTFDAKERHLSGLAGDVKADARAERSHLEATLAELEKSIGTLEKRLANPGYVEKAPAHLVQQTRDQLAKLQSERDAAKTSLERLG